MKENFLLKSMICLADFLHIFFSHWSGALCAMSYQTILIMLFLVFLGDLDRVKRKIVILNKFLLVLRLNLQQTLSTLSQMTYFKIKSAVQVQRTDS